MFTSIARKLVEKFASDYIHLEGINLNIEKGNIHLENVQLRETALAALDMPVDVEFGIVKKVVVQIPWLKLTSKPTVVLIDGVYVVVRNRTDFSGSDADKQALQRKRHLSAVSKVESQLQEEDDRAKELEKKSANNKGGGADGIIDNKFLRSIIDNLQVNIRNIHIRYMDETSFLGHKCALGVAVREITVYPFDRKGTKKVKPENAKQFRSALREYFAQHASNRSDDWVNRMLDKFDGKEDVLFDQLEAQYGVRPDFSLEHAPDTAGKAKGKDKPKFLTKQLQIEGLFLYVDPTVAQREFDCFQEWRQDAQKLKRALGTVFDFMRDEKRLTARYGENAGEQNRIGAVAERRHVLQPLTLRANFTSRKTTPSRDLALFDVNIGTTHDHDAQVGSSSAESASRSNAQQTLQETPTIALRLTPMQLSALLAVAENLTNYRKYSLLRGTRPVDSRPSTAPKQWWRYVIQAIITQVRQRMGTRKWVLLCELLRVRERYLPLYRKKVALGNTKSSKAINAELEELDCNLTAAQVTFFRRFVRRDERHRRQLHQKAKAEEKAMGNWFQRTFATSSMKKKLELNQKQLEAAEQEWERVQAMVAIDNEELTPWTEMHAEDVVADIHVALNIRVHVADVEEQPLVTLKIQSVCAHFTALTAFQDIHASIGSLELRDESTSNTAFPLLIAGADSGAEKCSDASAQQTAGPPLLSVDLCIPPRDRESDVRIDILGQPLNINVNLGLILDIVDKFTVHQPLNLEALQEAVLKSVGLATAKRGQDALSTSEEPEKPTRLFLTVKWPLGRVSVPEDVQDASSSTLRVNLGSLDIVLRGHELEDQQCGQQTVKYLPIDIALRGLEMQLLPSVSPKQLLEPTDITANVMTIAPHQAPPPCAAAVKLRISAESLVLNVNGPLLRNLMRTAVAVVGVLPSSMLGGANPMQDAVRTNGFDMLYERDITQARLRRRYHDHCVRFLDFDSGVLRRVQEQVVMDFVMDVPTIELCLLSADAKSGDAALMKLQVSNVGVQINSKTYDSRIGVTVGNALMAVLHAPDQGSGPQSLSLLSFEKAATNHNTPAMMLSIRTCQPLSSEFEAMRGNSEIKVDVTELLQVTVSRGALVNVMDAILPFVPLALLATLTAKVAAARPRPPSKNDIHVRNCALNGGNDLTRRDLQIQGKRGEFQHFLAMSFMDIHVASVVLCAQFDDGTPFAQAKVDKCVLGMCTESQAMLLDATVLRLTVLDLTELGESSPTILCGGGHSHSDDQPVNAETFLSVSMWMFTNSTGTVPDMYVRASMRTLQVTFLNRFITGLAAYALDPRVQQALQNMEKPDGATTAKSNVARSEVATPAFAMPDLLPDIDVSFTGFCITIPSHTGAQTFARTGIESIAIRTMDLGQVNSELELSINGMYTVLQCGNVRSPVDLARIETLKLNLVKASDSLSLRLHVDLLELSFSVQHFETVMGLLNNFKEPSHNDGLVAQNIASHNASPQKHPARSGVRLSRNETVEADEQTTSATAPLLPFDLEADFEFGGIKCLLLRNLPDHFRDKQGNANRLSVFDDVEDTAIRHALLSELDVGPLRVAACTSTANCKMSVSVSLQHLRLFDRRAKTVAAYEFLVAAPSNFRSSTGTPKAKQKAEASYRTTLDAFNMVIDMNGSREVPFMNLTVDVHMNPVWPRRMQRVALTGKVHRMSATLSPLVNEVLSIFQVQQQADLPPHIRALIDMSKQNADNAATEPTASAVSNLQDGPIGDLMRGDLVVTATVSVTDGALRILYADTDEASTTQARPVNVPAGFLLQWAKLELQANLHGLRMMKVQAGVQGVRLGVRQVGLPLQDSMERQLCRDIIPSFDVTVGLGTELPASPQCQRAADTKDVDVLDDWSGLIAVVTLEITRIKVFVSSYILAKAISVLKSLQEAVGTNTSSTAQSTAPSEPRQDTEQQAKEESRKRLARLSSLLDGDEEELAENQRNDAKLSAEQEYAELAIAVAMEAEAHANRLSTAGNSLAPSSSSSTPLLRSLRGVKLRCRANLQGVVVFVAADLPTTNFGILLRVFDVAIEFGVESGIAKANLELLIAADFKHRLREPLLEKTRVQVAASTSLAHKVPAPVLAVTFDTANELSAFLVAPVPSTVQLAVPDVLNINLRQATVSDAVHSINSITTFLQRMDAEIAAANSMSECGVVQQLEREKLIMNVQTLTNDTGLHMQFRMGVAWNAGNIDNTWPCVRDQQWRNLAAGETIVVEDFPYYVDERLSDRLLWVRFRNDAPVLNAAGFCGAEEYYFSDYALAQAAVNRAACTIPLTPSTDYTILSKQFQTVSGMELGMQLRTVPRELVKVILAGPSAAPLDARTKLFEVILQSGRNEIPSVANAAGLLNGDFLLHIDDQFVLASSDLDACLQRPSTTVTLSVVRELPATKRMGALTRSSLVFERGKGGTQSLLRSELTLCNDLHVPLEVQFFVRRNESWVHRAEHDAVMKPDGAELNVSLDVVLRGRESFVRVRPVVESGSVGLPFSPLCSVSGLCALKLSAEVDGDRTTLPGQPDATTAEFHSMTPKTADDAAVLDQAELTFPLEGGRGELFCVLDVRHDELRTPQLSIVPAFRVQNLLPVDVEVAIDETDYGKQQAKAWAAPAQSAQRQLLHTLDRLRLISASRRKRGKWAFRVNLKGVTLDHPTGSDGWSDCNSKQACLEHDTGRVQIEDKDGNHVRLNMEVNDDPVTSKFADIVVFAPFWVVNRTGLPLLFTADSAPILDGTAPIRVAGSKRGIKIKAMNRTPVNDVIDALPNAMPSMAAGSRGLSVQTTMTFMSDKNAKATSLRVRAKLQGTQENWSGHFTLGGEANGETASIPCSAIDASIKVANVSLPFRYSRSKLVLLQPSYVIFNDTDTDISVRQLLSRHDREKRVLQAETHEGTRHEASVKLVGSRKQVAWYFQDTEYRFLQFQCQGDDKAPWSGAIDVQAVGYYEIQAHNSKYAQVSVFESRSIVYIKLEEQHDADVYTRICNTCTNEYVRLDWVVEQKQGSGEIDSSLPENVSFPELNDNLSGVCGPHTERPVVPAHPTLRPIVDVVVMVPDHEACDTGMLREVGSVRVDLQTAQGQVTEHVVDVPSLQHKIVVRLSLEGGITQVHVTRPDSCGAVLIHQYLEELGKVQTALAQENIVDSLVLVDTFREHENFLQRIRSSSRIQARLSQSAPEGSVTGTLEETKEGEADGTMEVTREECPVLVSISVDIAGLGVSLVADPKGEPAFELLYLAVLGIKAQAEMSEGARLSADASIDTLQIDSRARGTSYPILFYRHRHVRKEEAAVRHGKDNQPVIEVAVVVESQKSMDYFRYANVLVQALCVDLDTPFLNEVLELVGNVSNDVVALGYNDELQKQSLRNILVKHTETKPNVVNTNRRIYVEHLVLQPVKLSLRYTPVGQYAKDQLLPGPARAVLNLFGGFAKIDTDLTLDSFIAENVADNRNMFTQRIQSHMVSSILRQVYRIVFGLQTLGNPMKLFTNVGNGAKQLFYEPSEGAVQGGKEFLVGVGKGTLDFLGGITQGVTGVASAGLESAAAAVEQLSLNKDYVRDRQAHRANAPKNALHGVGRAGKGLAEGIGGGLAGIFLDPVKGAKAGAKKSAGHAIGGFFKGVGQGLLGVVVKPTAAIVSGTGTILQGIHASASLDVAATHIRFPRLMTHNILCHFSVREGMGCVLMHGMQRHVLDKTIGQYLFHFMCASAHSEADTIAKVDQESTSGGGEGAKKSSEKKEKKDRKRVKMKEHPFLLATTEHMFHGVVILASDRDFGMGNRVEVRWATELGQVESVQVTGKEVACLLKVSAQSGKFKGTPTLTAEAATESDALAMAHVFWRFREQFQATVRFQHQLRVWLVRFERMPEGATRVDALLADNTLQEHHVKAVAGRSGGGRDDTTGGRRGPPPPIPSVKNATVSRRDLKRMMKDGRVGIQSASVSRVDTRARRGLKLFSKETEAYNVAQIVIKGIVAGASSEADTVFFSVERSYQDFQDLRGALKRSLHRAEKKAWSEDLEAIWDSMDSEASSQHPAQFSHLVKGLTNSPWLELPRNKVPLLWDFFTEDFVIKGCT